MVDLWSGCGNMLPNFAVFQSLICCCIQDLEQYLLQVYVNSTSLHSYWLQQHILSERLSCSITCRKTVCDAARAAARQVLHESRVPQGRMSCSTHMLHYKQFRSTFAIKLQNRGSKSYSAQTTRDEEQTDICFGKNGPRDWSYRLHYIRGLALYVVKIGGSTLWLYGRRSQHVEIVSKLCKVRVQPEIHKGARKNPRGQLHTKSQTLWSNWRGINLRQRLPIQRLMYSILLFSRTHLHRESWIAAQTTWTNLPLSWRSSQSAQSAPYWGKGKTNFALKNYVWEQNTQMSVHICCSAPANWVDAGKWQLTRQHFLRKKFVQSCPRSTKRHSHQSLQMWNLNTPENSFHKQSKWNRFFSCP